MAKKSYFIRTRRQAKLYKITLVIKYIVKNFKKLRRETKKVEWMYANHYEDSIIQKKTCTKILTMIPHLQ